MIDTTKTDARYTFAIDTNSYSGNFEREMFAYIFGAPDCPGEATRDLSYYQKAAEIAEDWGVMPEDLQRGLLDVRINDPGDDGIKRAYVAICPTPGFFNDGLGVHYEDIEKYRRRFKTHYPAYQSVAVFLQRRPTVAEVKVMKKRAQAFCELPTKHDWETRPKILGFRLLVETPTWVEEPL